MWSTSLSLFLFLSVLHSFFHRYEIFFQRIQETIRKENVKKFVWNSMFQLLCMIYVLKYCLFDCFYLLRLSSVCTVWMWSASVLQRCTIRLFTMWYISIHLLNYKESANSETGENKWMSWFCGTDETCNENVERNQIFISFGGWYEWMIPAKHGACIALDFFWKPHRIHTLRHIHKKTLPISLACNVFFSTMRFGEIFIPYFKCLYRVLLLHS